MTNETMILHPQNTQMKNATSKIPQLFKIPQIQTTHIKHEIYNFITLLTPLSHRKNLQEHNLTQKLLENNQQPNKKQTYNQTEKKHRMNSPVSSSVSRMFRLYLSLILSPRRFRVQNLLTVNKTSN